MDEKLKKVMATIFGVDVLMITEEASPESIETWDSLKQMNLILALEDEFDVVFSDEELVEMLNYKLIRTILQEHLS